MTMFASLFRHLPSNAATRKTRLGRKPVQRRPAWRLELESLEERSLLSGVGISVAGASFNEPGDVSAFITSGSGGLNGPRDLVQGPDGYVYVASLNTNSVLRYNG